MLFRSTSNGGELARRLSAIAPAFMFNLKKRVELMELEFIHKIQADHMTVGGRTSPKSPNGTRVITGMLRRNWFPQTVVTNNAITARVFSTTPYAPIHIYGGDVTRYARSSLGSRTNKQYTIRYAQSNLKTRVTRQKQIMRAKSVLHPVTNTHQARYPARLAGIPGDWEKDFQPKFQQAMVAAFQEAKR